MRKVLTLFPYAERDYKKQLENSAKLKRLKELEATQELLMHENERLKKEVEALRKVADTYQYP